MRAAVAGNNFVNLSLLCSLFGLYRRKKTTLKHIRRKFAHTHTNQTYEVLMTSQKSLVLQVKFIIWSSHVINKKRGRHAQSLKAASEHPGNVMPTFRFSEVSV